MKPFFFLVVFVATVTTTLCGQPDCNTVVVDEAHVFNGQTVNQAARRLMRVGADVRVRTFETMNSAPTMEIFEHSLEAQCPSWRAVGGGRKSNLVVLLVSVKSRKTGLYYGSQWKATLDPHQTRIQVDVMNPYFRNQDFEGGFEKGLSEIERILTLAIQAPVHGLMLRPDMVGLETETKHAPVDLSGLWVVMYWGLAFCALATVVVFGFRFKKNLDEKKERLDQAKYRALIADQGVSSRLVELSGAYDGFEAIATEKQRPKEVKVILDSVTESYARLKSSNVGNPDQKLSASQYIAIANEYEKMREKLERASFIMKGGDSNPTPTKLEVALARAKESRLDKKSGKKPPSSRHQLSAWSSDPSRNGSSIDYMPIIISQPDATSTQRDTHRSDSSSNWASTPSSDSGGGSSSWDSGGSSSSADTSSGGGGDSSW